MSKIIRFTDELVEKLRAEFEEEIKKARIADGKFSFNRSFNSVNDRAVLRFTEQAYLKMTALVSNFEKEVAWHCVVNRGEEENEYVVSDILVYPQTVSGVHVDMDVDEYVEWINKGIEDGDDRFFHLHGQGHSHVNMAVSPSPTDLDHQKEILKDIRDNGFYVFMIWNKKDDHNIWIYDIQKNKMFENKDITLLIDEEDNGISKFLRAARQIVKENRPVTQYSGYGGYNNIPTKAAATVQSSYSTPTKAAEPDKKKSKAEKTKVKASATCLTSYGGYWEDDNDPTSPFYVRDNFYQY